MPFDALFYDDNCWVESIYAASGLEEFLDTGFYEMRRVPMGVFYYYYYSLHRISENAHLIWNALEMAVQAASALLVYSFARNLKAGAPAAFLTGAAFFLCPLDGTLPYRANITYRLGTLLCIASFYLTERGMALGRRGYLAASLSASAVSAFVFLEASIVLEPARLFLIWGAMGGNIPGREATKKSLYIWAPFAAAAAALALYRLLMQPYGLYASTYKADFLFFLDLRMHAKALRHLLFFNWVDSLRLAGLVAWPSLALGGAAAALGLTAAGVIPGESQPRASFAEAFRLQLRSSRSLFFLGLLLVCFPLMLYEFTGRVPAPAMEGRHGTLLQFGYALSFGALLSSIVGSLSAASKITLARAAVVAFIAAGVFFNNFNLDIYTAGEALQRGFWREFAARFPSVPEGADFLIDARGEGPIYRYADLEATYDFELPLNMLYAKSDDPRRFRAHRVYAVAEGIREWRSGGENSFERPSHWGMDAFDPKQMIFVYHRPDEGLLLNSEILKARRDAPYAVWLDRPPPLPGQEEADRPMRRRLGGFFEQ